ncbi:MAG: SxtJ family membrane protein [Bacteroidota bacterium]
MKLSKIIVTKFSQVQLLETSLVIVILSVILGTVQERQIWLIAATIVAGIGLLLPRLLYSVAVVWFSLGNVLSLVISPILLTMVFLLIITPIGIIRRWLGHDSLQLKKRSDSVFKERNHVFSATDLKNPF